MTAKDKTALKLLPGEIFEAIHPAIDFNRDELLRPRAPLTSRVVALLARPSRRERAEAPKTEVK